MKLKYITTHTDFPSKGELQDFPFSLPDGVKAIGLDTETYNAQGLSALDYHTSKVSLVQVRGQNEIWVIDTLQLGEIPDWLQEWLEDPTLLKVIQNASFEYKMFLYAEGIEIQYFWCTLIAEQVLKCGLNMPMDLGSLIERYCKIKLPKDMGKSDWGKRPLTKKQFIYAANDPRYLIDIYLQQKAKFKKHNPEMEENFWVEMEDLPYFCETEKVGTYFNSEKVHALYERYKGKMTGLLKEIQSKLPWVPLTASDAKKPRMREKYPDLKKPVTSNNDFKRAFNILNIPIPMLKDKVTKKLRESLSADTYHLIKHPVGPLIQEYTGVKKLLTSYIEPLLPEVLEANKAKKNCWIHPLTGRAHPNIRQNGTNTSRPAYKDPPLQTVPKKKEFRECVEAQEEDWVLVKADYSQIELRVGCVVCQDPVMLQTFIRGEDIHTLTASKVLGKSINLVSEDDRYKAKAVNFGLIFDQSAEGFRVYAKTDYGVDLTPAEAKAFKKIYGDTYPGVKRYQYKVKNDTRSCMYFKKVYVAEGLTGRKRFWRPGDIPLIAKGEHAEGINDYYTICKDAINYPIQNGNAECMKRAMIVFRKHADREELRYMLILQVHDELVIECHKQDAKRIMQLLYGSMIQAANGVVKNQVPIDVEVSIGRDWGNMKKVGLK